MRHRGRPVWLVATGLLVASIAVAACTGAATPATGPSGSQGQGGGGAESTNAGGGAVTLPDPCSLLTQAEIKAQFTFDVNPGMASSPAGSGATSPDCHWSPVDFHTSFTGVSVIVQEFDEDFFDFMRRPDSKDVPSLGDKAYFDQPTNPITLWMRSGNLLVAINVTAQGTPPEELQQKVIALANNVLAHL